MLSSEKQLDVLARIWGRDRDGYVFLPWISGSARDTAGRRANYHEGRAFEWPKEANAIIEHLDAHPNDDVYFTPALFNAKRRIEQNVDSERTLWADLDPVDPSTLEFKPTIAWETSPGRYQGVWLLNTPLTGASWPSRENHRLTLAIGADPSGWDSTQLLRVPGRYNHKPHYRGEGWKPAQGKLLWTNGPRYVWSDFDDLPEVGSTDELEAVADESNIDAVDRHEVWGRVKPRVSKRCRELLAARDNTGADRSDALWEVERELADAGCSAAEIIAIVRPSVWNKYKGRNDELKRLKIEAAKAIAERGEVPLELDPTPEAQPIWVSDLFAQPIPRPRWLVSSIWTEDGCGFIAGAPKSYKSWMALDLAVSVATGTPFLGIYPVPTPRPVLYLQEEDDVRLVADRLEAIIDQRAPERSLKGHMRVHPGGALKVAQRGLSRSLVTWQGSGPMLISAHIQQGFIASDPKWQAWLADMVKEHEFGLVIIDTLGTTAGDVDTDRATDLMLKILAPLKRVAKDSRTAICVVHHNRKPNGSGTRAGMEMLGSVALHAWVDCALYAREKDPDGVVAVMREAKMAPDESFRLRVPKMYTNLHTGDRQLWDPQLVVEDVSQPVTPTSSPSRREASKAGESIAKKLKMCGGGPMEQGQLEDIVGTRGVAQQIESAITNGFIVRGPDGRLMAV